jgi:RNA polymerase sigma-70 factor (ECF subfamily)
VFVRCWERIGSFRGDSLFGTWLHRVAVNVVLERARTDQRQDRRFETGTDTETLPGVATDPRYDERMDLEQAIQALPPKARQVFVLHDIEGYRHREIAELTGSAQGTLRAQLHRARKLLMEALS